VDEAASEEAGEINAAQTSNTESPENQPQTRKSSVITKSVPVKRGGRREEAGRVPRVPLFAAPSIEPTASETASVGDALPTPAIVLPTEVLAVAEVLNETPAASIEAVGGPSKSRNSRNRKKKGAAKADITLPMPVGGNADSGALLTAPVFGTAIGTAEQLSGGPEPTNAGISSTAVLEVSEATSPNNIPLVVADVVGASESVAASVVAARKPSRKSRVISGGRAEKPAVDTPVIPVPDASQVRTQVAAGRLMGSSATLVEPTAPLKKPAAPKKTAASKTVATKQTPEAPASLAAPKALKAKAALPKAKPAKAAPEPVPVVVEQTLELAPAQADKPEAKAKPAAKPKAVAPKATAAKVAKPKAAVAKPTAAKAVAPKAAAKPKVTAAKDTAAKPTAAKPKPPKKPAKPA
jgi:hypothetical protein